MTQNQQSETRQNLADILEVLKRIESRLPLPEGLEWLEYPAGLANELKISISEARSLRQAGYVPSVRRGGGKGKHYFHRDDLALCREVLGL